MVWQTRVTATGGPPRRARDADADRARSRSRRRSSRLAGLFAGIALDEQKALLAQLERAGAAMYRGFAESESDAAARAALLDSARREEENAEVLEGQA